MAGTQTRPEAQIIRFFQSCGYSVTAPVSLRGLSGFEETFDVSAIKGEDQIVLDIACGEAAVGPEKVVAFFAKVFDAKPRRPILICVPGLNHDAASLARMYKIETIIASDMEAAVSNLSGIFGANRSPPAISSHDQSQVPASIQSSHLTE